MLMVIPVYCVHCVLSSNATLVSVSVIVRNADGRRMPPLSEVITLPIGSPSHAAACGRCRDTARVSGPFQKLSGGLCVLDRP